jgi:hypothetical protein
MQVFPHPDGACSLIVTDGRLAFRTTLCLNATHRQRDVNALWAKATGFVTAHGPVNLDLMTARRVSAPRTTGRIAASSCGIGSIQETFPCSTSAGTADVGIHPHNNAYKPIEGYCTMYVNGEDVFLPNKRRAVDSAYTLARIGIFCSISTGDP